MYPRCEKCGGVSSRKNKLRAYTKCRRCGHRQRVPGIKYTRDPGFQLRNPLNRLLR